MSEEPYRAGSTHAEEDVELARLAAEGQRKIQDAAAIAGASREASANRTRDELIRAAIGGHFGSAVRKAARTLFIAIPVLIAGAAAAVPVLGADTGAVVAFVLGTLATVSFVAAMVLVNMQPMASPARVAAERAWSTSLPFAMDGYFELLALDCSELHIVIDVEWAPGRPAEVSLVQGAAGALDVDARAEAVRGGAIRIRSGPLPGTYTDFHRNRRGSNRQHVAYVHALIDRVLLPVHRSHPIARIALGHDTSMTHEEHARMLSLGALTRKW